MAEQASTVSQENSSPFLGPLSMTSPCPSSPSLPTLPPSEKGRLRKPPTITPRSFTRFFTPKLSTRRSEKVSASRRALRDITGSGSNGRLQRKSSSKELGRALSGEDIAHDHSAKRRKITTPASPDFTLDSSSPLKRIHNQSIVPMTKHEEIEEVVLQDDSGADTSSVASEQLNYPVTVKKVYKSNYRKSLGWELRRETGSLSPSARYNSSSWQYETSNFYSKPEDSHLCSEVNASDDQTIPFCVVACQTNSLVAIGDEDGGVRMLESAQDRRPGFSKPWVTFKPHSNAILDLAFSPDDMLLATASGDQTSHVIDMPTQQPIYTLTGHASSVKRIRFQPASSHVLATSSRDGSVKIWDLRCKGPSVPVNDLKVSFDSESSSSRTLVHRKVRPVQPVDTIFDAHARRHQANQSVPATHLSKSDKQYKTEAPGRRGDISVTGLVFLPAPRSALLVTASEANASVKLWDLRTTHYHRRCNRVATPLSTTREPESHSKYRPFGLTSLSISGDGARLYTLCRDNTVYAYSTAHLILGNAPELSSAMSSTKPKRSISKTTEKTGLGPIYGFRHPKLLTTTFYVSSAIRSAKNERSELLAVGSSDGCPVLFPTNEQYLQPSGTSPPIQSDQSWTDRQRRPGLTRTDSGFSARLNDTIPIYQHGTALVQGHNREVTGLTWTHGGDLVTLGDDYKARCWREADRNAARTLRTGGGGGSEGGLKWRCGWAEVGEGWDDDEC